MPISRRTLLFCAPAIIPYSNLMKIPRIDWRDYRFGEGVALTSMAHPVSNVFSEARDLNEQSLVELLDFIRREALHPLTLRPLVDFTTDNLIVRCYERRHVEWRPGTVTGRWAGQVHPTPRKREEPGPW